MSNLLPNDKNEKGGQALTADGRKTGPAKSLAKPGGGGRRRRQEADEDDRDEDGVRDLTTRGDQDDDDRDHRAQVPSLLLAGYHERLVRERRSRQRRLMFFLSIFVFLPTLLSAVIFSFFITPRYVSEAQITIQSENTSSLSFLSGILAGGGGGGGGANVTPVLIEYIHSSAMLDVLQSWLNLKEHYSQDSIDPLSRLSANPTNLKFLEYYQSRVEATFDSETSVLLLRVQAYDPDYAKALADGIIALTEDLANSMSNRQRDDSISFARKDLERAEERLKAARLDLVEFRALHKDIDPESSAAGIGDIIKTLEGQLSGAETEMAGMRTFMREDSPQMIATKARIGALKKQLEAEKSRLTGSQGGGDSAQSYNQVLAEYEQLVIEEEFARQAYTAASQGFDAAKASALRQSSYLVDFVPPTFPDEATEPQVGLNVLTTFLLSLLAFALLGLIVTAIREQAGL